jgi:3-oxoadipate enol-lactonase
VQAPPAASDSAYHVAGAGGPWVVLIHCLGGSADMWWRSVGSIARTHRVLTYDLRGHGATTSAGPWTMEDLADDAAAVMARAGIGRASVIGAAMGGMVAQLLASRHPERVERTVIANTASHIDEAGAASFRERAKRARAEGLERIAAQGVGRYFTPDAPVELVERVRRVWAAMDREGYARTCEAIAWFDARPGHARIQAPVLVIGSEADPTSSAESARALAASLPDARVEIMARGAHLACVEEAPTFNDLVTRFLRA